MSKREGKRIYWSIFFLLDAMRFSQRSTSALGNESSRTKVRQLLVATEHA